MATEGTDLTPVETEVIARMKTIASEYGLWYEVKADYEHYRTSGMPPERAAFEALYDWDLVW